MYIFMQFFRFMHSYIFFSKFLRTSLTKDLALITSLEDITVLSSEGFIKEVRNNLEKNM